MGLFDFITQIFSKSDKGEAKKKTARKKAIGKAASPPKGGSNKTKKKPLKKTGVSESSASAMPFSLDKKSGKKRKKSKQVSADPINEQALGFSISLKDEDERSRKRNALRITVKGLEVHVIRLKKKFAVTDISATGLGFAFEKPRIKGGVKLEMDLYLNGEKKTSGLIGKVMRHDRGSVGCVFQELDRSQDDAVHEIVLLGQKEQAERKSKGKDKEFNRPE